MKFSEYLKHGPQNEIIKVKSLKDVPGLFDTWFFCIQNETIMPFVEACPLGVNGVRDTKGYVDNFDPNFITSTFVIKSIPRLIEIPTFLKEMGIKSEDFDAETFDASTHELVLLKHMGYSRWNEVKHCFLGHNLNSKSFHPCKRALLKELDILED